MNICGVSSAITVGGIGSLYFLFKLNRKIDIEGIHTISDAVAFVKSCNVNSADTIADAISASINENGISTSSLMRLSELQRIYGEEAGMNGFVSNIMWSTTLHMVTNYPVVIIHD